jgi:ribosomal protein L7/L12
MAAIGLTLAALLIGTTVAVAFVRRGDGARAPVPSEVPPPDLTALDDDAFRARVLAHIEAGRTIEAIRVVRERTRLGLADAKALVEALASGDTSVDLTLARETPARAQGELAPSVDEALATLDPDLAAQLVVELAAGRKVEAIKLLRERTGLGLKEARDAVEALGQDDTGGGDPPHWDRL